MNHRLSLALAAGTSVIALAIGFAAPASAATADEAPPRSLEAIQASALLKISQREASLSKAINVVTDKKFVSDADRAAILSTLNADAAGLTALGATIAADTDRATAAEHYAQIFSFYRVYAVALPQAHYAAAADALTGTGIPRLQAAHDKLATALGTSSKSTPELEATLVEMQQQIDAASAALVGVAAGALAVTPDAYNTNHAVLSSYHASVVSAVAAAKAAKASGKTVLEALK